MLGIDAPEPITACWRQLLGGGSHRAERNIKSREALFNDGRQVFS